jgi:hypothetical protein
LDPLQIGKCHRKRARPSTRTFGSTVRPTSAHWVITPGFHLSAPKEERKLKLSMAYVWKAAFLTMDQLYGAA